MRILQIIAWVVFTIGIVFRLFDFPGTSLVSVIGTFLIVLHGIISFFKTVNTNLPTAFLYLSVSSITVYFLFRLQYWYCGPRVMGFPLLFIITLLVSITCIVLHLTNKSKYKTPQLFLMVYFISFLILSFVHSHSIYYFFHLNSVTYSKSRKISFQFWDKYSWFLYIANKKEEALEANDKAKEALEESRKVYRISLSDIKIIEEHRKLILTNNWKTYP